MIEPKETVYYNNAIPPTYVRLVSERMHLDHIVCTAATRTALTYADICQLEQSHLFDKILVYADSQSPNCESMYIRYGPNWQPFGKEIVYVTDRWIDLADFIFQDDITAIKCH